MPSEPIWRPSKNRIESSNLRRFIDTVGAAGEIDDYESLYAWSIADRAAFWTALWDFCGIVASSKGDVAALDLDRMPGTRWFPEARLNFAENLLQQTGAAAAILFVNERGARRELSWDELHASVAGVAAALRDAGVGPGDRIVGLLPNIPETVIAMLASASLGAVWSSCSPDFGASGVLERFGQIAPTVLFGVDGYFYAGKNVDCLPQLAEVVSALPTLRAVYVASYRETPAACNRVPDARPFPAPIRGRAIEFVPLPFDHPLYVLYTSGTTGLPKSIVHGAGGTLLQHRKEHVLHTDLKALQRIFYFTTCGWMMWHWLVSALATRATIVLYDGAPMYPDPGVLWRIAETEQLDVFGTSAKYLSALEKSGYVPRAHHDLGALKSVLSTGSPLSVDSFDYVYYNIKDDLQLSSISGGTDLISCFALGNPMLPVYRGELQCRGLGMKVEIFDGRGRPVTGEKGELVCTASFPSMPIGLWNDPGNAKYHATYFARYPGVWCHGDYAELTTHGGLIMHGRSDTVLNPGGVRIGTAEIYRVVEQLPEIAESIVVAQDFDGDTRAVLFVRLNDGAALDDDLRRRIRDKLRAEASPRHVPAKILDVPDIPRTRSGKIVEVAVREAIHGRSIDNLDALANPEALEAFRGRVELQS
jgi:acetoacetyl-CoA synthetase